MPGWHEKSARSTAMIARAILEPSAAEIALDPDLRESGLMKASISKDFHFEAAHVLTQVPPDHKCASMHGHSYRVTVVISGEVDEDSGWLRDHAEISDVMKPLIASLDHHYLNDIQGLDNPTFEMLAKWFWDRLKPSLPELSEIIVHETPTVRCSYVGS